MDNIYCCPNSAVLRNKLNIHDKDRLCQAEIRLVAIRLYQLQESPIRGDFDFNHLCRIHRHIFQDIYSRAGEIRTVNIAKGNMFCLVQHIRTYAQTIFPAYYEDCMRMKDVLKGSSMRLRSIMLTLMRCTRSGKEMVVPKGNLPGNCV